MQPFYWTDLEVHEDKTAYVLLNFWTGSQNGNPCDVENMKVLTGITLLPNQLLSHTIYILDPGTYITSWIINTKYVMLLLQKMNWLFILQINLTTYWLFSINQKQQYIPVTCLEVGKLTLIDSVVKEFMVDYRHLHPITIHLTTSNLIITHWLYIISLTKSLINNIEKLLNNQWGINFELNLQIITQSTIWEHITIHHIDL